MGLDISEPMEMNMSKFILNSIYLATASITNGDETIMGKGKTGTVLFIYPRKGDINQAAVEVDGSLIILGEHLLDNGTLKLLSIDDAIMTLGDILGIALNEANAEAAEAQKITNKLTMRIAGNDQYRVFYWNKKIELIGNDYSYGNGMMSRSENADQYGIGHPARMIYDMCSQINLVEEVSVKPYEMSIKVTEGFENDDDEWTRIIENVRDIIQTIIFKDEDYRWNILDKKAQYTRTSHDDY